MATVATVATAATAATVATAAKALAAPRPGKTIYQLRVDGGYRYVFKMVASGVRAKVHVVLLVEDNADLRALYGEALRASGLIVDEVESIEGALRFAARLTPDLVLLDRGLPDGDGWRVARSLKADEATRHVPIVAFTALRERADVEGALVAGCDAFLEKGCSTEALVRHVRGMLGLPLDTTDEHAVLITARARRVSALS